MEQLPTPHNNNARSLIETQLSPAALEELDLDTLQLETGSFIDADLSKLGEILQLIAQSLPEGRLPQWIQAIGVLN